MIEWTPEIGVGIDTLGNDNNDLIRYLSDFICAVDQGKDALSVEGLFREVITYTEFHFAREERFLVNCIQPFVDDHYTEKQPTKKGFLDYCCRCLCDSSKILAGHESAIVEALSRRVN